MGWDGVYAPGVWAGQSSTSNPRSAEKLVREVVKKVAAEMKKAGLIREGGPQ